MKFENLLSRFDIATYQSILGPEIIGTLNELDPKYHYKNELNRIILNTYSEVEILINKGFRNTIIPLLREEEALALLSKLDKSYRSNPWKALCELNFTKDELNTLIDFFNLPPLAEESRNDWITSSSIAPAYSLYPYQRTVLGKIRKTLISQKNRVLLHMPTGSGKTRTTMSFVCRHLIENENTIVIWFANTIELLDQSYNEFLKAWGHLGNRELKAYKIWGESDIDLNTIDSGFVVAGLEKAYNILMDNISAFSSFASKCSLVIMDEAHQAIAPTYKLLLESIVITNKASLIGLSATPGRTWNDRKEDAKLADFFHHQKIRIEISGYENPIDYLISQGYLAKTTNTSLLHKSGISLSMEDYNFLKSNYHLSNSVLDRISKDRLRNILITTKVQELAKIHKRILVFGITKNHAILLNSLLVAIGLDSSVITSDTPKEIRNKAINSFKVSKTIDTKTKILCNFGILTTGFDAPETSCAVIARPTDSLVLYSQMVGRVIRGIRSGGNTHAEIVTVVDESLPGFGKINDAYSNWEDVWNNL